MKTISTLFDDTTVFLREHEKEQAQRDRRPLTEKQDPLALSWAAYHVWENFPQRRWVDWADIEARDHDITMAEHTRRYYRDKIALRALSNNNALTAFQKDLYDICNGGILRECHRGMLYRLPYFYAEDVARQELRDLFKNRPAFDQRPVWSKHAEKVTMQLAPVMKIFKSRKNSEIMEYWFQETSCDHPVMWAIKYDNPLRSMVDNLFDESKFMRVSAYKHNTSRSQEFNHWHLSDVELKFGTNPWA